MESGMTEKQKIFADEYIIGEVYCIENTINHKKYIGITTRSVAERFKEHRKAQSVIGKAIRKYGAENFLVTVLDYASTKKDLCRLEIEYIKKFGTFRNGYNQTIGGDGVNGDFFLDPVLNKRQARFVNFVEVDNKKKLDVQDGASAARSVLLNLVQIYLLCNNKLDKRETAKLILKLDNRFLGNVLSLGLFTREELERWSVWRNTQTG